MREDMVLSEAPGARQGGRAASAAAGARRSSRPATVTHSRAGNRGESLAPRRHGRDAAKRYKGIQRCSKVRNPTGQGGAAMNQVQDLHREAMRFVDEADSARRDGNVQ